LDKQTINKINMAKPTNEYIFYGKTNNEKKNCDKKNEWNHYG
jgi:hypothetical protein